MPRKKISGNGRVLKSKEECKQEKGRKKMRRK